MTNHFWLLCYAIVLVMWTRSLLKINNINGDKIWSVHCCHGMYQCSF